MLFRAELRVHFDGAFNVGSGAMGGSQAQQPALMDWRGLPMVPASSLKGRLRHTCKQLEEGLRPGSTAKCGEPMAEAMCQPAPGEQPCRVCRLFGSPWVPAAVSITDLLLVEPAFLTRGDVPPRTSLRHGVGLSRRRRVAEDQLLYTTEVFLPGGTVTLGGEISGDVAEADLGLLVAGLENLLNLGGGKTRGLGWCDLEFDLYRVEPDGSETPLDRDEVRRRWLND